MKKAIYRLFICGVVFSALALVIVTNNSPSDGAETREQAASAWQLGTPIVTYYAGPKLTDAVARQMAEGGWNLVWCDNEAELDIAQRHGLRGQFPSHWPRLPRLLDDPAQRAKLDAMIDRVRNHPAFYQYFVQDEPSAADFPRLGRLVAYLRERDPQHLAYINLFPTIANNKQLGVKGDTITAYEQYLRQYLDIVKPSLLSYDHYHFAVAGDCSFGEKVAEQYFLNLAMIRQTAKEAGIPFLNIVQACSWAPSMRVPTGDEMRFLVYTTLAYGAQGISYYVYCAPNHTGGITLPDGTPTPIYHALKPLNREFVAIATELQPLDSLGVYHAGMLPLGTKPLPKDAPFRLDPPVPAMPYENFKPVKGMLLGFFGPTDTGNMPGKSMHVLVVNLDYKAGNVTTLVGPKNLETFDATTGTWSPTAADRAELRLPPGGGKLLRLTTSQGGER